MKFNLEKVADIAKKTVIGAEVVAASILPLKSISNTDNDKLIKGQEIPHKNIEFNKINNINFIDAQNDLKSKNKNEEIGEENIKIIESIIKLEKKIKELSKGETEIAEGSISLLSGGELLNKIELNTSSIYNSPLNNRYITELVTNQVFNKNTGLKLMNKDYVIMKESQSLHDEGWVDYKDDGYTKHLMPEYYFVIDQNEINGEINFEIKIIYSKIKRIDTIKITEKLPAGDILEIEKFVSGKIANDLSDIINNKIKELIK